MIPNIMDFIIIRTTGDAIDFGDLQSTSRTGNQVVQMQQVDYGSGKLLKLEYHRFRHNWQH